MAAVLCSSIGSCCSGLGQCVTFPCRACGTCCASGCAALGSVLTSPFTPYLLTTVVLNFPPVAWGVRTAIDDMKYDVTCNDSNWLYVNALLSLVHLLAAFYIVHRIQEENGRTDENASTAGSSPDDPIDPENEMASRYQTMGNEKETTNTTKNTPAWQALASAMFPAQAKAASVAHTAVTAEGPGDANSFQRLKQVFCYDIGVAMYMICIIFWFIWQSVGISQVLFSKENGDDYLCENIEKRTILSILCGFLYIMLVMVSFCLSFLCLK